jgi:DNA-binding GntR family transcriptional regulator
VSGATLRPIPGRSTLREHVLQRLRTAILGGVLEPGTQLVEMQLAEQLGVSRGPLREAIRELIEERLLVNVPYTGTFVMELTARDAEEVYSLRTMLESFAFRLAWDKRPASFTGEIEKRHRALLEAIDARRGPEAIDAELHLHSLIYETSGHRLLLDTWRALSGRLHLYFAMHQRAHGRAGPRRDAHERYVELAKGNDLAAVIVEIEDHMQRGLGRLREFLAERERAAKEGRKT